MDIILENPFRILGVLSNASIKEIVGNQSKIKAFIKIGKPVTFDNDFSSIMPSVIRNIDTLTIAINAIALGPDKLSAGFFWFISITDSDQLALNKLRNGEIEDAIAVLSEETTVSSYLNLAVLYLIKKDWTLAIYYYTQLFSLKEECNQLVDLISDNLSEQSKESVISLFVRSLFDYFPNVGWMDCMNKTEIVLQGKLYNIGNILLNSNVYKCMCNIAPLKAEKELNNLIISASSVEKKNPKANLDAASELEKKSIILLRNLRLTLGKNSAKYVTFADRVSNQILDNCIDYYNYTSDIDNRSKIFIKFIRFAMRTAEGKLVKDRCKSNFDIIQNECEQFVPNDVENELSKINFNISSFSNDDSFNSLDKITRVCYSELMNIKNKIGENNEIYINTSSRVVMFVINSSTKILNRLIEQYYNTPRENNEEVAMNLRSSFKIAKLIMDNLKNNPMDMNCKECYEIYIKKFTPLYNIFYLAALEKRNNVIKETSVYESTLKSDEQTKSSNSSETKVKIHSQSNENLDTKQNNEGCDVFSISVFCFLALIIICCVRSCNRSHTQRQNNDLEIKLLSQDKPMQDFTPSIAADEVLKINYDSILKSKTSQYSKWLQKYKYNSLKTGSTPYQSLYGKNSTNGTSSLSVNAPSSADVLVLVKNESGKVIKHAYIKANQSYEFTIKAGFYQPFFIFGRSWCPEKKAPNGSLGYFLEDLEISKDCLQEIGEYQSLTYTLQQVVNGNFHAASSNAEEAFK